MVLTLYVFPLTDACRTVLMTARHLGIEVNSQFVDISKDEQLDPEFLKMNPTHTVPTLDDDGFYLWESRAIQAYFVNQYSPDSSLYPKNPKKRALVDRMLYFDSACLCPAKHAWIFPQIFKKQKPDAEKVETFKNVLTTLDGLLSQSSYAAGDEVSLADISILANISFLDIMMDYDFSDFKHICTWMDKLKSELPYYEEMNENILLHAKPKFLYFINREVPP